MVQSFVSFLYKFSIEKEKLILEKIIDYLNLNHNAIIFSTQTRLEHKD